MIDDTMPETFTVEWVAHDGPDAGVLQSAEFADEQYAVHLASDVQRYTNTDLVSHTPWVGNWSYDGRISSFGYDAELVQSVLDYAKEVGYPLTRSGIRIANDTVWVEGVKAEKWFEIVKLAVANRRKSEPSGDFWSAALKRERRSFETYSEHGD